MRECFTLDAGALRDASSREWADAAKPLFDEYGIVLLEDLLSETDLRGVQADLSYVIGLTVEKLRGRGALSSDAPLENSSRFDAGMLDVCAADRSVGGEIFRVAKKLLSVQRLTTGRTFEHIAAALMGSDHVTVHPLGTNVRADHPNEDHYLYPWHQDYLYNLGSLNSVTFWAPLVDVDDVNGCLLVAPGSHKWGIFPVHAHDPLNRDRNSAQSFTIADLDEILRRFTRLSVPMAAGDAVVFHGNLLHSSQPNRSRGTRWSLQLRYFDLAAPDAVERGWPGGMAEGFDFARYHPEAVIPPPPVAASPGHSPSTSSPR